MAASELATRAVELGSAAATRHRAVDELLELAGEQRQPLEAAVAELQGRLVVRSDDVGATHGLRVAERALARAERSPGAWGWQARERRRRRRRR